MKINKRYVLLGLETALFILTSLVMTNFVASVTNFVGSTDNVLKRMLPYYVSVVSLIYLLFVTHLAIFPKSEKKLKLTYKVNGLVLSVIALAGAILILTRVIDGEYSSFVSGVITPLFPLDAFLWDLVIVGIGIYLAIKGFRFKPDPNQPYFPYEHGLARKIFGSFFRGLYTLVALYFTGAFLVYIFIANYGSSTWFAMLSLWLLLSVPGGLLFYHDWFYKKSQPRDKSEQKKISLVALAIAGGMVLVFVICLLVKRNFIVEDATALFLIDYMKSWNLVPYLASLMALLPPLVAFLSTIGKKSQSEIK
jgi:hypothetical protein